MCYLFMQRVLHPRALNGIYLSRVNVSVLLPFFSKAMLGVCLPPSRQPLSMILGHSFLHIIDLFAGFAPRSATTRLPSQG